MKRAEIPRPIGTAILCAVLFLLSTCCPGSLATPAGSTTALLPTALHLPRPDFQKGLNYIAWAKGQFATPESDRSLVNLTATGANWVAIAFFGYQQTYTSTIVTRDPSRTPSDKDLTHAIATAHDLGLQVMLKPHVDLRRDRDHWRGNIGEAFTGEAQWQTWFESYGQFINHYAALAQENGVEQFCVGTELVGTSHREADWRNVVAGVRERFAGPITYAGNHGTEDVGIAWWDAVDLIGVDAYYVLTDKTDPTVDELKTAWVEKGYVDTMASLAEKYDRPVLITEIGYRSADGTIKTPWDWDDLPLDLQEQADAYRAALEVLWGQPWLAGIYWWNWDVNPQKGGPEDKDYTSHGKPAEEVLRTYYGGEPMAAIEPTPQPAPTVEHVRLPAPSPAVLHPGWTSYTVITHVNDLVFDRDGNLWVATPGGLVRWDVASGALTRYTEADGLSDNWVEMLAVASGGELWIATSGGISRFDPSALGGTPASGRGGHAWITYDKDNGLPCNGITDIAFAPDGDVWVGTFGCGAARFDGYTWTTYTEEDGLLERHVLCVTAASDGSVLFGTWAGVSHFDGRNWFSYTTANGLVHHGVETIAEDSSGALWFGTWNGVGRLSGTIWTSYTSQGAGTWVESIAIAPDDAALVKAKARAGAWAGTREGVARFDEKTWTWAPYFSIEGQPKERGVSIAFAPDGSLWVGTYNSGIYRLGEAGENYAFRSGPPSNEVSAIAAAPDGTVWVGTRPDRYEVGGGVARFDPSASGGTSASVRSGQAWTTYTERDGLAGDHVTAIAAAPGGAALAGMWVGTQESGVSYFDGHAWHIYTSAEGLASDRVTAIAVAPGGAALAGVWIGTQESGVFYFDGHAWQAHPAPGDDPGDAITSIFVAADGTVWVGTQSNGLWHFDGLTWEKQASHRATAIAQAPDGTMWFGFPYCQDHDTRCLAYDGGSPEPVARLDPAAGSGRGGEVWTGYTPADGLPESGVRSIAASSDGTIWVGTESGGAYLGGETWQIFAPADGLVSDDVRTIAIDADGTVWIGADGGVSHYTPLE